MSLTLYGHGGLAEFPTPVEEDLLTGVPLVNQTFTGSNIAASNQITGTSDLTGVAIGDVITGPTVPANTHAVDVDNVGHSVTLDQNIANLNPGGTVYTDVRPQGGNFAGKVVALLTVAPHPPFKLLTWADISANEAAYDGYARSSAVAWSAPVIDPGDDHVLMTGDKKQFVCTGSAHPETIVAAAIIDPAGPTLIQIDVFDAPITMAANGNGFDYVPLVSLQ